MIIIKIILCMFCFSDYLGTAAITGIVIGGIIFIAVVVTLCVVCVCGVGKRGSSGNIINPHPGAQSKHDQWVQRRMVLMVNFVDFSFHFLCFVVAIFDIVHACGAYMAYINC